MFDGMTGRVKNIGKYSFRYLSKEDDKEEEKV
jgi:hypothetical protein